MRAAMSRYPRPLSPRQVQAAKRGAVAALAALYSDAPSQSSEALLAAREQLRIDAEATLHAQGALNLEGGKRRR